MRSTSSTMTFPNPFRLAGHTVELPAGDYVVLVQEERLQGLSFEAYRRTATYLTVRGRGRRAGITELWATSAAELEAALDRPSPPDISA